MESSLHLVHGFVTEHEVFFLQFVSNVYFLVVHKDIELEAQSCIGVVGI